MIFILAHSHAVGFFAYLALIEFFKEVVCKLIEGGGDAVVFWLYNSRLDLIKFCYEFLLCCFKVVGRDVNLLVIHLTAYFLIPVMIAAAAFVNLRRNSLASELFSECSRHTVNLLSGKYKPFRAADIFICNFLAICHSDVCKGFYFVERN